MTRRQAKQIREEISNRLHGRAGFPAIPKATVAARRANENRRVARELGLEGVA